MNLEEKILIVDDEEIIREMLAFQLRQYQCILACNGKDALDKIQQNKFDLVLTDIKMPKMNGLELLKQIKDQFPLIGVIMITALADMNLAIESLKNGADDYITKPFNSEEVKKSVEQSLQKRKTLLDSQKYKNELETKINQGVKNIGESETATIIALAKLAEFRDPDSEGHLDRVKNYTELLTKNLRKITVYKNIITVDFMENIVKFSPLHDLGKIGIPDQILFKPGIFTLKEFLLMQKHTLIGGDTLKAAQDKLLQNPFLSMAKEIAYYHHERFDGTGYPFGLKGEEIPLCARIVSLVDVYDAITSVRPYKAAIEHQKAVEIIKLGAGEQFDPEIVKIFLEIEKEFENTKNKYYSV